MSVFIWHQKFHNTRTEHLQTYLDNSTTPVAGCIKSSYKPTTKAHLQKNYVLQAGIYKKTIITKFPNSSVPLFPDVRDSVSYFYCLEFSR